MDENITPDPHLRGLIVGLSKTQKMAEVGFGFGWPSIGAPPPPPPPPSSFTTFTTLKSDTSGEHWVTPFGIPATVGAVSAARAGKIFARKTGTTSPVYPVGVDNVNSWTADSTLKHCAAHLKLPASYTAMDKWDIGYSDTETVPTSPNWSTGTSSFAASASITLSVYRPPVYMLRLLNLPICGGVLSYDAQTANFTVGTTITGGTSGATGIIVSQVDGGATGTLQLRAVTGTFQDNALITGSGGSATVNGTISPGDTISVTLDDSNGAAQTYSRTLSTYEHLYSYTRNPSQGAVIDLVRDITLDPSGRFKCFENLTSKPIAAPSSGDISATDYSMATRINQNGSVYNCLGYAQLSRQGTTACTPDDGTNNWPRFVTYQGGDVLIWPRWVAGDPEDLTTRTFAITQTGASTLAVPTSSADTSGSTSGNIPQMYTAQPRVTWTAQWTGGTDVSGGAWFNNHQTYQMERICSFVDGSSNVHPHLTARIKITWALDGTIIDRQISVENNKMFAACADYWYDVTAITIDAVNVISGVLADYRHLYHTAWARWRWRQDKAFGCCAPEDFMAAGLIATWRRTPSEDTRDFFKCKTLGADTTADDQVPNATNLTARGGYALSAPNKPLWAQPWKFDSAGGGAGELGHYTFWDWSFWRGDIHLAWEHFESMADNGWNAFPWHPRDEQGPTGWTDTVPHPYLRWYINPSNSAYATSQSRDRVTLNHRTNTYSTHTASTPDISLWTGSYDGAYEYSFVPSESHSGCAPARSAYLVCPESYFHETVEMWAWAHGAGRTSNSYDFPKSPLKTSGTAGDADHVIGYDLDNGNRNLAWTMRSYVHAASIMFDDHPRRSIWRRVCDDYANHFNLNTTTTWNGFFHGRGQRYSDNWQSLPSQVGGERYRELNNTGAQATNTSVGLDLFKGSYCMIVAGQALDFDVCDTSTGLTAAKGYFRMVDDLPAEKWWMFINNYGIAGGAGDSAATLVAATPTFFATEDMDTLRTTIEALASPYDTMRSYFTLAGAYCALPLPDFYPTYIAFDGQSATFTHGATLSQTSPTASATITGIFDQGTTGFLFLGNITGTFTDNRPITDDSGGAAVVNGSLVDAGTGGVTYVQNYPRFRFTVLGLQAVAAHTTVSADQTIANSVLSMIDTNIPPSTVDGNGNRYDYLWGAWSQLPKGTAVTAW